MGKITRWSRTSTTENNLFTLVPYGIIMLSVIGLLAPKAEISSQKTRSPSSVLAQETGSAFEKGLKFSLKWEGGYSNVAGDAGGRTFKGITEAVARQHGFSDPRHLSDGQIKSIYFTDYWLRAKCGEWQGETAQIVCLDTAINYGSHFESFSFFRRCNRDAFCIVKGRKAQRYRQGSLPLQSQFVLGWLNRDNDLESYIGGKK